MTKVKQAVNILLKYFRFKMFECGNDQPEKEVNDEVKKIVEDIQPQLEEKLGKSLVKIEASKFSSQVFQLTQLTQSKSKTPNNKKCAL